MPQEKPKKHVRFNETLSTLSEVFGAVRRKTSKAKDETIEELRSQLAQKETSPKLNLNVEQIQQEREREREQIQPETQMARYSHSFGRKSI